MWRIVTCFADSFCQFALLQVCASQKLLDSFVEANKLLESVQKGLADYLETKRLAFPRFFFLSNDELLQILSQTKNPLAVQVRRTLVPYTRTQHQDMPSTQSSAYESPTTLKWAFACA